MSFVYVVLKLLKKVSYVAVRRDRDGILYGDKVDFQIQQKKQEWVFSYVKNFPVFFY